MTSTAALTSEIQKLISEWEESSSQTLKTLELVRGSGGTPIIRAVAEFVCRQCKQTMARVPLPVGTYYCSNSSCSLAGLLTKVIATKEQPKAKKSDSDLEDLLD